MASCVYCIKCEHDPSLIYALVYIPNDVSESEYRALKKGGGTYIKTESGMNDGIYISKISL